VITWCYLPELNFEDSFYVAGSRFSKKTCQICVRWICCCCMVQASSISLDGSVISDGLWKCLLIWQ